jgi:hypothetical protein
MQLGDYISVSIADTEADFWVIRRGSPNRIGRPVRLYAPEHYGIRITARDKLDPNFLFYMFEYLANQGYFRSKMIGSTNLVNIRKDAITSIELN